MGMHRERLEKQYPRYDEKPFDSDRKMMTTYHRIPKNGGHKGKHCLYEGGTGCDRTALHSYFTGRKKCANDSRTEKKDQ